MSLLYGISYFSLSFFCHSKADNQSVNFKLTTISARSLSENSAHFSLVSCHDCRACPAHCRKASTLPEPCPELAEEPPLSLSNWSSIGWPSNEALNVWANAVSISVKLTSGQIAAP